MQSIVVTIAQRLLLGFIAAAALPASAQTSFRQFREAADAAMGTRGVSRIELLASGWEACMGQPWAIAAGWARWELTDYHRVLDYSTGTSLQTAQRRAGLDRGKLGGCGAQPDSAETPQRSNLNAQSPWVNQLPLWLTPQGFLALAQQADARVESIDDGWLVSFETGQGGVRYPFTGRYNADHLLQHVSTRIDDSVFGDMLVEAGFAGWQDFDGIRFPASLVLSQGGFPVLDLVISGVVANTAAPSEPEPGPPRGGNDGGVIAQPEGLTEVAPGIYVSGDAYQGVIVDTDAGIVVIDGLQNDARSDELIAQAREAIPGKPFSYVISTHNHFDHASGLRAFMQAGATLITHESNAAFFRAALAAPRTLDPAGSGAVEVHVLGVGDTFVIGDSRNPIELYKLTGSSHADDMLIAWLPGMRTVVEADLLQPWINPVFGGGQHPFLVYLADELDRLGLDYERFIPVHRPPQPPFMTREDLLKEIGRL
jgi:glyoxylase-like metal-dependent hydrolase (beta-lactamase superfamily II)